VAGVRKGAVALVAAVNVALVVGAVRLAAGGSSGPGPAPASTSTTAAAGSWESLGPEARCASAAELVRRPNPWPTICTWREPGVSVRGQSYPPPVGDPPWDRPRVEIYVAPTQSRVDLAHTIAHELGHMTHTRDPTFVPQYLQARGLPADTPSEVWTEDYAEVFATLFGPPVDGWRATTTRPAPAALAALEAQFFTAR
jgi:hypothetical protein